MLTIEKLVYSPGKRDQLIPPLLLRHAQTSLKDKAGEYIARLRTAEIILSAPTGRVNWEQIEQFTPTRRDVRNLLAWRDVLQVVVPQALSEEIPENSITTAA